MRSSARAAAILTFCLPCVALAAETEQRQIDVTSYINGSYNYLERSRYFTSGGYDRVNDTAENGARLQQLFLSISSKPDEGFGALTEMAAGLDAYSIAPLGWNANMFNIKNVGFAVPDAYLHYGYHGYKFSAGVIESIAGFEAFNYLDDNNFSRGIIYGYVAPGVHATVRVEKQINDEFEFIIGTSNGWSTLRQPGHIKGIEAGLHYQLSEKLSGLLDVYLGNEYLTHASFSGPEGKVYFIDFYGTYLYTDKLSFNWNLDYAAQSRALLAYGNIGRAEWSAAAGYVNYQFTDLWYASLRAEIMNDGDGFRTGVPQVWKEVTLSLGYEPIKHLSIIAETRHDFSNVSAFVNKNGINSNNNQQSYALEALYQFI